jgi:chorismate synthase
MIGKRRQAIELEIYDDEIRPDDKDANFKQEMVLYSHVDPLKTLSGLSTAIGVPEGAIARYVLAKWASEGAAGILEVGQSFTTDGVKISVVQSGDNDQVKIERAG